MKTVKNLKIIDTAYGGSGVGKDTDGMTIFVPKTVEGDIVNVLISGYKNRFAEASLLEIIEPSPHREETACAAGKKCGGCAFAHIKYQAQIDIKLKIIKNALRKYPYEIPQIKTVLSERTGYRLRLTARARDGRIGFFEQNSNNFIPIEKCLTAKPSLMERIKDFSARHNLTGEIYVIENDEGEALARINASRMDFAGDYSFFAGAEINGESYGASQIFFGTPYGDIPVSYRSFFQANRFLLKDFQERAVSLLSEGLSVTELYAGAGFFTAALMKRAVTDACESDKQAADMGKAAGYNISCRDAADFLKEKKVCEAVFLDPPRNGLDKRGTAEILRLKPAEIIYVSCNPITLGRDITRLCESYKIDDFYMFDMYPDTFHAECIAKLIKIP